MVPAPQTTVSHLYLSLNGIGFNRRRFDIPSRKIPQQITVQMTMKLTMKIGSSKLPRLNDKIVTEIDDAPANPLPNRITAHIDVVRRGRGSGVIY
jgi:hypothetical protein